MDDILTLLTTRRSNRELGLPAPDELQTDTILQAATQVPDHGKLQPWRFIVIHTEEGRRRLHTVLENAAKALNLGEETEAKAKTVAYFAPLILAVIASPKKGKPEWEQQMSAASAAYAAQLAAKAQGFDSVWITGLWVNTDGLRAAFDCTEQEKIIGLVMIGTAQNHSDEPKNCDTSAYTAYW